MNSVILPVQIKGYFQSMYICQCTFMGGGIFEVFQTKEISGRDWLKIAAEPKRRVYPQASNVRKTRMERQEK